MTGWLCLSVQAANEGVVSMAALWTRSRKRKLVPEIDAHSESKGFQLRLFGLCLESESLHKLVTETTLLHHSLDFRSLFNSIWNSIWNEPVSERERERERERMPDNSTVRLIEYYFNPSFHICWIQCFRENPWKESGEEKTLEYWLYFSDLLRETLLLHSIYFKMWAILN